MVAARAGVVLKLEERFEDGNGVISEANYVLLRHEDGSASVYFHLTRNGALVELGESVAQSQPIALSGQTGRDGIAAHLHFGELAGYLDALLALFEGRVLPFDAAAARRYAELSVIARKAGHGFPVPDA